MTNSPDICFETALDRLDRRLRELRREHGHVLELGALRPYLDPAKPAHEASAEASASTQPASP
jgi:hypothetical protein